MPQFDFFAWASISFWTVLSFHIFYLFMLRFVLSPISEIQKAQQKIQLLFTNSNTNFNLKELYLLSYFKFKI
jgi:F0F1-type ATP synthase membrane subunit b/b'